MLNLRRWPQLAAILKYDEAPYILPAPSQVEDACAMGDRELCGEDLLAARLDLALAGLMREFGQDYFLDNLFPSRFAAMVEILTAARVFLEQETSDAMQEARVRLLSAEAETVLEQWNRLAARENGQTLLFAAEEPAELS